MCAIEGIFIQVLPLAKPIKMKLAVKDLFNGQKAEVKVNKKARISTTLQTNSGPLRLKNAEYCI